VITKDGKIKKLPAWVAASQIDVIPFSEQKNVKKRLAEEKGFLFTASEDEYNKAD